jgi:xanthine dehydrogenase accessory factor
MMLSRVAPHQPSDAAPAEIFRLLAKPARAGERGALVTIVGLEGRGARAPGTHMAVLANGGSAGSLSSGCVEKAIVAEALDAIAAGAPRRVRFGEGSAYIDIRLPCGGGIDVLIQPDPPAAALAEAARLLERRIPVLVSLGPRGEVEARPAPHPDPDPRAGWFSVRHLPRLRLIVAGHGAEAGRTIRLAALHGADVRLLTPDEDLLAAAAAEGIAASRLVSAASDPGFEADRWTAILFLFHEHEWEIGLLRHAVASPAFWIGAMGSPATHERRCAELRALGVADDAVARVRGPVGLIPSTRDPATLALSAVAEIAAAFQALPS